MVSSKVKKILSGIVYWWSREDGKNLCDGKMYVKV
jgi:hypothetical protein